MYKDIGIPLNGKAMDVIKTDRFGQFQKFKGFKYILIMNRREG
jgi:hypothetical protein